MASADPGAPRAWQSPRAWIVLLSVLIVGLTLDLGLKHWAFQNVAGVPVLPERGVRIPRHEPVTVVPGVLNLHLVKNDGAVFGIGANKRMFFVVFTLGALAAALVVFARWTTDGATSAHVALGLILAGGLGNLYDRICFGVVRDFLHMIPGWKMPFGIRWWGGSDEIFPWVFNAADVMLLSGMVLLMIYIHRTEKERKLAQDAKKQASESEAHPESA